MIVRRRSKYLLFLSACALLVCASSPGYTQDKLVYKITLSDDVINPVTAEYISKAIEKAENDGVECLIIELDTPGGLLTSTRAIVKWIMGSKVPIVVYVAPSGARAGSAGVFITLAAHIAAMAPSTNIGAAHPVALKERRSLEEALEELVEKLGSKENGGKRRKGSERPKEPMEEKVLNDTKAWVTTIATTRGRNANWAVRAVEKSISVDEDQALREGIIDLVAEDMDKLLSSIEGREVRFAKGTKILRLQGAHVVVIPKSARQNILSALVNPNIAYMLLMLGFYGLLFEFTHPGVAFPGIAGTIAVIIAFYSLHLLAANYAGVALIILGVILFIMEIKITSYGLLTLGGVVSVFLGSLLLFDSPYEFMRVSVPLVLTFTASTLLVVAFLIMIVIRTHRRKITTGREGLVGLKGEVIGWNGGRGKVFIHGEIWEAEGGAELKKGDGVEVIEVRGMRLIVR